MTISFLPAQVRRGALAALVLMGVAITHSAFAANTAGAVRYSPPVYMKALSLDDIPLRGVQAAGAHNSCCTPPLVNGGGPVLSPAKAYLDFWGAQWTAGWPDVAVTACGGGYNNTCTAVGPTTYTNAAATVQNYMTSFFSQLPSGLSPTWNNSQSQYGSAMQPGYGGSWVDTASVPPAPGVVTDNCVVAVCLLPQKTGAVRTAEVSVEQLATEALAAESHFGYDANANILIFLPQGSWINAAGACAYHSEVYDASNRKVSYSAIPYVPDLDKSQVVTCGMNYINTTNDTFGHGFLDGYSMVAGHEFAEAETDPYPFTAPAWRTSDGGENADTCAWGSVSTYPAGNVSGGGQFWAAQSLWSNSANACAMN